MSNVLSFDRSPLSRNTAHRNSHRPNHPRARSRALNLSQTQLQFAAVLLIAAVARALALWIAARQFSPQWLFTRGREMGYLATALLQHEGFSSPFGGHTGPTALIGPAYPLFVAAVFRLFGSYTAAAALAIFAVQAIVALGTVALVMRIAVRVGGARHGRQTALTAGLVWACAPPLLWMPTILWDTTFTTFLVTAMVLLALRFRERCVLQGRGFVSNARRLRLVMVSAAYGLCCLVNPALLPLALLMAAWLSFYAVGAERFRSMALALVTVAAVFSPWPIRNAIVLHAFVPMRTTAGLELWMGNHPGSTGHMEESMFPIFNAAEMGDYVRLGEVQYGRDKAALATAYIESHRARFAALTAERALRFWTGTGTRGGSWAFGLYATPITLFGFLGLLLLALHRHRAAQAVQRLPGNPQPRHPGQIMAFLLPLLTFPLPYLVSHAEFRYRLTIDPLLTVLAAYALVRLKAKAARALSGDDQSRNRGRRNRHSARRYLAGHDSRHAAAMAWTTQWRLITQPTQWRLIARPAQRQGKVQPAPWRQRLALLPTDGLLAGQSGQTLVVAALSIVAVVAFMGLAIDVGHLRFERRHLQTAADAAALAAGLEFTTCGTTNACAAMQTAAQKAVAENGYAGVTTTLSCASSTAAGVIMTLNQPACMNGAVDPNAGNRAFVEVELTEKVNTYFAQVVGFNHVPITVRAEAGKAAAPCIYALDRTPLALGITMAAGTLQADCPITDESNAPLTAFNCVAGSVVATKITVGSTFGLASPLLCSVTPAPQQYTPLPTPADPLAYVLQNNPIPTNGTCTGSPLLGLTSLQILGTATLQPGRYCGGITIGPAANVTFEPGVYVLTNTSVGGLLPLTGGLTITVGATVQGTGVTFYNVNTAALPNATGGITFAAHTPPLLGNVDLEAPTSGPYAGLLFMQDANDTAPAVIVGSTASNTKLVGGFYFPSALVTYAVAGNARFNILVAKDIVFGATLGGTAYETSVFGNDYSQLPGGVSPIQSNSTVIVQ